MLQPKKTRYRKQQKGKIKGNAFRGHELAFGTFGIKSLETCFITGRQIEAARQAVTRHMKREGQIWIRIFPDKPITKKPNEVRIARVMPGTMLFECEGVPMDVAKEALRLAAQKLPISTKFVVKRDYIEE